MLNITENLVLQNIESNNWTHDDLDREITTCWALHFTFYGIDGFSAFITAQNIDFPVAVYAMVESNEGDLHDSFSEQIESKWNVIVDAVKKWEANNFKEQTELIKGIQKNREEAGLV